jgi:hypothetical protein
MQSKQSIKPLNHYIENIRIRVLFYIIQVNLKFIDLIKYFLISRILYILYI